MLDCLVVELAKWRRTPFVWVTVAAAMASPLLGGLLLHMMRTPAGWDEAMHWNALMQQVFMFHSALIGPLVATLIGAYAVALEHQSDTWKVAFATGVARWKVVLAKALLALGWVLVLSALVLLGSAAIGWVLIGTPAGMDVARWVETLLAAGAGLAVMVPAYQLVALVTRSFFVASGLGIVATVAGFILLQSRYAGLFPVSGATVLVARLVDVLPGSDLIGGPATWLAVLAAVLVGSVAAGVWYVERADAR